MIRIKMGGYVDDNDKIMTKEELNDWILEIQTENVRLREALERIDNECGRDDTIAWKIAGDALEALKGGE